MISDYYTLNLNDAIRKISVEGTKGLLSTFSCRPNEDIEKFLKERSIDFSDKGIARTHLLVRGTGKDIEILGYYTLSNKIAVIPNGSISNTTRKRLERFGVLDAKTDSFNVAMPLIAQLGKNYTNDLDKELEGAELLDVACKKVAAIQYELGGRFLYLECKPESKLIDFYASSGFRIIEDSKSSIGLSRMLLFQ